MTDLFEKKLGLSVFPDALDSIFEACVAEYDKQGTFFLEERYLLALQSAHRPFPRSIGHLLSEAARVRADDDAALYALFVCRAMEQRTLFLQHLTYFDFPTRYPLFALLCFAPALAELDTRQKAMGLPEDVAGDSLEMFEVCAYLQEERTGVFGMEKRYFDHMQGHLDGRMLNVERLRFEMTRIENVMLLQHKKSGKRVLFLTKGSVNTDGLCVAAPPRGDSSCREAFFKEEGAQYIGTAVGENGRVLPDPVSLPKTDYDVVLRPGDDCIDVHIPAWGAFTREICAQSYARAREIFKALYPEKCFKAFHCHSWMLAPELALYLRPTSNLLAFQSEYMPYPTPSEGEDVFVFVFGTKPADLADLPEDTSLRRALKQLYLGGGCLYEYCGVIPF